MSQAIALIGAYTMNNYGDKLYPPLLESLLRSEGFDAPVSHYALQKGFLEDGTRVDPLASVRRRSHAMALVGGGDLIRMDRRVVAMDHQCVPFERRGSLGTRLRAQAFVSARRMNSPGPWLPRDGWGCPAFLASVGVHELPDTSEVRRALSCLSGAWVRTQRASGFLHSAHNQGPRALVGPDAAFLLTEGDPGAQQARGKEILREATGGSGPTTVFHAVGFAGWSPAETAQALSALPPRSVALVLGEYAGEQHLLSRAASETGRPLLSGLGSSDITAVLAAAGCVVSTSMHAAIVASCFGTPVVVPGVEKTRSALDACPVPPQVFSAPKDDLSRAVTDVLGERLPRADARNAVAVRDTFRELIAPV